MLQTKQWVHHCNFETFLLLKFLQFGVEGLDDESHDIIILNKLDTVFQNNIGNKVNRFSNATEVRKTHLLGENVHFPRQLESKPIWTNPLLCFSEKSMSLRTQNTHPEILEPPPPLLRGPSQRFPYTRCAKTLSDPDRSSHFAAIRIANGSQRFQIAWFESQGQKPFESLLRLYLLFMFKMGLKSCSSSR